MTIDRNIRFFIDKELGKDKSKIVIITGQRQVGKTFELNRLKNDYKNAQYFDLEDIDIRPLFVPSASRLEELLGGKDTSKLLLLDEIQYLNNAGSVLKIIHDHFPLIKVVVTGSASFLLLKNLGDSLYGRYIILDLYPLSLREVTGGITEESFPIGNYNKLSNKPVINAKGEHFLIYGGLPDVYLEKDVNRKINILKNYLVSLLFKDIFEIEGIRHPEAFKRLLKLLALQIGNEVNSNELAQILGINRKTVLEYIYLYEKFCIIYILRAYSENPRKEMSKKFKVYFSDLGIRNSLADNFSPLDNRNDAGGVFENFCVNILMSNAVYFWPYYKMYFWRNFGGAEVDFVIRDVRSDKLIPIEIKYRKTVKPSRAFLNAYGDKIEKVFSISKDNFWKFI